MLHTSIERKAGNKQNPNQSWKDNDNKKEKINYAEKHIFSHNFIVFPFGNDFIFHLLYFFSLLT